MHSDTKEMRREVRSPGEGSVRIRPDTVSQTEILGQLLDTSASGFRASYQAPALSKGQAVRFEHGSASGIARVIWNRIVPGTVETGFLVVRRARER